jgi:phosphate transport system protein
MPEPLAEGAAWERKPFDGSITQLFVLVSEALAGATHALLSDEPETARMVIERDARIDRMAADLEDLVWATLDGAPRRDLPQLVALLLILPELERSADLAEHIAQRAVSGLGREMTPVARGVVQRMAEAGLSMWTTVANDYRQGRARAAELDEADEEMDLLLERLTREVASGSMTHSAAAQVTLLARFYERLGDHAVNLARRIDSIPSAARPPED